MYLFLSKIYSNLTYWCNKILFSAVKAALEGLQNFFNPSPMWHLASKHLPSSQMSHFFARLVSVCVSESSKMNTDQHYPPIECVRWRSCSSLIFYYYLSNQIVIFSVCLVLCFCCALAWFWKDVPTKTLKMFISCK